MLKLNQDNDMMKHFKPDMKSLLLAFLSLLLTATLRLQAQEWRGSVITDPSISIRCQELVEERTLKINHKQRISALIVRNKVLQKITPDFKKSLKGKIQQNYSNLERELYLAKAKIEHLEENIVRKGCPGIGL